MKVSKKSFRQYTIQTSFGKIHTLECGSGQPVIFFHGWSIDGWAAENVLIELSKKYRVIVPTMPGSYPSFAWKKKVEREHFEEVLAEWFRALHLTKAIIVGHSLGGVLAILLSRHIQKDIQKLVLIDTVGASTGRTHKEWAKAWLKKRVYTYKQHKTEVSRIIDRGVVKNLLFRTRDLVQLSRFAKSVDVSEIASDIKIPVTILWGEDDLFTPQEIGKKLHEQFTESRFIVVPGNHDWPLFVPKHLLANL